MFEAPLDRLLNRRKFQAGRDRLGTVQDAIGPWRFRCQCKEFRFICEKLERLVRNSPLLDPPNDPPGGDRSGIGQIVDAEGEILFEAIDTGCSEFREASQRVFRVEQSGVVEQLGQVISGRIA
jgi:hypothetical protein